MFVWIVVYGGQSGINSGSAVRHDPSHGSTQVIILYTRVVLGVLKNKLSCNISIDEKGTGEYVRTVS